MTDVLQFSPVMENRPLLQNAFNICVYFTYWYINSFGEIWTWLSYSPIYLSFRCLVKNMSAVVELEFDRPICLELYKDYKDLGRFMLRYSGHTIAAGLVEEVSLNSIETRRCGMSTNETTLHSIHNV